ncbi:MAG: hypothetical protein AAFY08_14905 [Planctomycetota bacterium]
MSASCNLSVVLAAVAAAVMMATSSLAEVTIDLREARPVETVSPMVLGLNLSYFNDLDEVWETGDLAEVYRDAGIGALRYPGGEETSRFHWEHPGVTGYIDLWNESHHDQSWQSVLVPKDQWGTFEDHMDFDEFVRNARTVGAEPLVGINMSSGVKLDRVQDSIDEAVRWMEYAKSKGYGIRYWYLDNEPWHTADHNYLHIPLERYAELCVRFARAMCEVDPDAKFIVNPLEGGHAGRWDHLGKFMAIAGDDIDVVSFHWYWEWGRGTWETWLASKPMRHSSKWTPYDQALTYVEKVRRTRGQLAREGYDHVTVASTEWNISSPKDDPADPTRVALMHAEMLMQFAEGGLELACIWPGFWQIKMVPGPSEDRAWIDHAPPHRPKPALSVVRLLSAAAGGERLGGPGLSTETATPTLAVRSADGRTTHVFVLSKSSKPTPVELSVAELGSAGSASATTYTQATGDVAELDVERVGGGVKATLPPFSLTRFDLAD